MKKSLSFRSGSALLIVIGMLSFMVVSAVAFSALMRSSRLPSSYLRRVVSSRMLVKGAMAEAIDEIDAAVGDFPHPGVWNDGTGVTASKNTLSSGGSRLSDNTPTISGSYHNYNTWLGRVYIGGTNRTGTTVASQMIPQNQTVSPLCLEALAYIPPPLVSEARYYSRHSRAATWHTMGYDAGRYAFCALDVSDYFDINALSAGYPRDGSSAGRISLSYLFEDAFHENSTAGAANNWQDQFIATIDSSRVPLVSMADWNLAMGNRTFGRSGSVKSHFYKFATSDGTTFYNGDCETEDGRDMISRMAFVTDGWFPTAPGRLTADEQQTALFDLTDEDDQPFTEGELSGTRSLSGMRSSSGEVVTQLRKSICELGLCALWDYLDKDDTPYSLAIPTVERNPMIAALNLRGPIVEDKKEIAVKNQTSQTVNPSQDTVTETTPCHVVKTVTYQIEGLPSGYVVPVLVYPFRNKPESAQDSYTFGARISYFLGISGSDSALRTSSTSDSLHLTDSGGSGNLNSNVAGGQLVNNCVYVLPMRDTQVSVSGLFGDKVTAVNSAGTAGENSAKIITASADGKVPTLLDFLKVVYEWDTQWIVTNNADGSHSQPVLEKTTPEVGDISSAECYFMPLDGSGSPHADFQNNLVAKLKSGDVIDLKLNVAVHAWIKNNGTSKIVDLVPACVRDDSGINRVNSDQMSLRYDDKFLGRAYPIVRFEMSASGNAVLSVCSSAENIEKSTVVKAVAGNPIQARPSAIMVGDPRFNHAPESWFYRSDKNSYDNDQVDYISAEEWVANCGCSGTGDNPPDGDIFMQTSDQCYLQSIYELSNLLRLTDFYTTGAEKEDHGWYVRPTGDTQYRFADSFANSCNSAYMWHTYSPFTRTGGYRDDFENAGFTSSGNGFKINPYSDNTNVVMAAFANTPIEWCYASTNRVTNNGISDLDVDEFNKRYAFNQYSSGAKIEWQDLCDVAGLFMNNLRSDTNGSDWRDVWDDMPWFAAADSGTQPSRQLCGFEFENQDAEHRLWNCDKKFLYGFWRECFDVRQQLFLVFVRSEPMLMGGGAVNQTPPALGARAVALVWRDPKKRSNLSDVQPHRTRVLFYRQFD